MDDEGQELGGLDGFFVVFYLFCALAIIVCPIIYFVNYEPAPLTESEEWLREFKASVRRNESIETRIGRMGGGIVVLLGIGVYVWDKLGLFKK